MGIPVLTQKKLIEAIKADYGKEVVPPDRDNP